MGFRVIPFNEKQPIPKFGRKKIKRKRRWPDSGRKSEVKLTKVRQGGGGPPRNGGGLLSGVTMVDPKETKKISNQIRALGGKGLRE